MTHTTDDNFCWENLPEIERALDEGDRQILKVWRDRSLTQLTKQQRIAEIAREVSAKVDQLWTGKEIAAPHPDDSRFAIEWKGSQLTIG